MQQRVMSTVLSFLEPLITAVLGRYIEGDIAKCLLFHRWGVEFKSENVKLKKGALDELGLPISIKKGFLKLLHITITYTFHVEVNVNGFFIMISPQHSRRHFDTKSNDRQKNAIKKRLLDRAEQRMLETEWKFLSSSMSYGELFVRSVIKHFVRNIKLNVTDVHIRYQDITTIPNHSFVFGVTIKKIIVKNQNEKPRNYNDDDDDDDDDYMNRPRSNFLDNYLMEQLDMSSSDEDQEQEQVQAADKDTDGSEEETKSSDAELDRKVITKQFVIESVSVYNDLMEHDTNDAKKKKKDIIWHHDVLTDDELRRKFEFIPSKQLRIKSYNYLVRPFGIEFNVFLHENFRGYIQKYPDEPSKWRPNVECDIELEMLDLLISTKQMFALHLWGKNWEIVKEKIRYHDLIEEMKHKRPQYGAKNAQDRKIWWQYLIECAFKQDRHVKGDESQFILKNIINFEYRKDRYVELYKRKMRPYKYRYWLKELDATETEELYQIEIAFPYSQILIFRCLAIAQLKKEMEKRDAFQEGLQQKKAEEQKNSFMITKLFYATQNLVTAPEESPQQYALNRQESRDIIGQTDFIKQIEEKMKYPDEYILCHFGLFLEEINVQLQDDTNHNIGLVQVGIETQFDIRSNSYLSRVGLKKVDVCLGTKRDLKDRSLLRALLTPITLQVDIETDSLDPLNKNNVKVHDVGVIELLLNPQLIKANNQQIKQLIKDVKQIVKRHLKRNSMCDVVPIEDGQSARDEGTDIIRVNDVLMIRSNKAGVLCFVALQSIHESCNTTETTVAGYWVEVESEVSDENKEDIVYCKSTNDILCVKLKNVLRNNDDKYLTIQTTRMQSKDGIQWKANDNEQCLQVIQDAKTQTIDAKDILNLD
eukprot:130223_1